MRWSGWATSGLTKPGYEIWQRGIGDICRVEEELVNELDAGEQDRLQALLRQLVVFTEKGEATQS
jgi:RecB family exonuclease